MTSHTPVMLDEVLAALMPRNGGHYVDGTFGGGGYSRAILEAADCKVLGIDRDPDAIARGQELVRRFEGRLTLVRGEFSNMDHFAAETDGVVLDLGVSSFQFDEPERGFSFREDGPLDMRMSKEGPTAADFVNSADEATLARVISQFGEERRARAVARAIVAKRPIARTSDLARVVSDALGPGAARVPIHPATRTFQALRIHVNQELAELTNGLEAATRMLRPNGRLGVVSFHSLEDRIVKSYLNEQSARTPRPSRHAPERGSAAPARFRLLTSKPQTPSAAEVSRNPRARSARLRAAERLAA